MTERIYRWLLRLYPRAFRDEFGAEMLATARAVDRDRREGRDRHDRRGRGHGHVRALSDAVGMALAVRADLRAERRRSPRSMKGPWAMGIMRDATMAVRRLRREPWFVLFVAGTLALAIGANTTLFGLADRLILRGPEHVRHAGRVVRVYLSGRLPGQPEFTVSTLGQVSFDLVRERSQSAAAAAAYALNPATTGRGADAQAARLGYASAGFFPLLGVEPAAGRFFADDAETGVIVLGDGFWRRRFGASLDALGQPLVVDDEIYTVIGIAPPGFTGAEIAPVDFWLPLDILGPRMTSDWRTSWDALWLEVIMRLRDEVTVEQANAELTAIHRGAYTGDDEIARAASMRVAPLLANDEGAQRIEARVVVWLTGVALAVLVIACANLASLLIARGARRTREVAVQIAIGASRAAVVRAQIVESLMLAGLGAAGGLAVTAILGAAARRVFLADVAWTSSAVNARVVVVSAVIAVAVGFLVGLLPALSVSRTRPVGALRQGGRDGTARSGRLRAALTVVQAALSVVLLVGAGLFVRSLWNAQGTDLGIDAERVLVVEVDRPSLARAPDEAREAERFRRRFFYLDVLDRVRQVPGVEHASVAVGLPFGNRFSMRVTVPGIEELPRVNGTGPGISAVADDYFATVGTPILEGRAFTAADRPGSAPVAIVNAIMAEAVWPGRSPIGDCVTVGTEPDAPCRTIVGVAGNTHRSRVRETPFMHVYMPHGQEVGFGGAVLLVRAVDPLPLAEPVRRMLTDVDPSVTFVSAEMLQAWVDPQFQSWRLGSAVFVASGLLALVVAAVGLYSVLAYLVAERRHEIGVRLALGARPAQVAGHVVGRSLGLAAAGVAIGLLVAAAAAPRLAPLLFDVPARDPVVFGVVAAILVAVAAVAALGPAARANRVDPVEALRAE